MGREGLGEGRTAQPTPDLPGRQGGGGILSSFLHWVSNKQPGSGSLTSPGSRHVHRHLQSQNHTNCGLNSISERNPCCSVRPSKTHSFTTATLRTTDPFCRSSQTSRNPKQG